MERGSATTPGLDFEAVGVIAQDGFGGAYVVWEREEDVIPSFIQHLDANGSVAPGWPEYGLRLSPTTSQVDARLCHDGFGGAIVAWRGPGPNGRQGAFAKRFGPDGPTPTQVALVTVTSEPGQVVLIWHGAGLDQGPVVHRRIEGGAWQKLGAPQQDSPDRLRYEDHSVAAGARYAYRLSYLEDGVERLTEETWVEVPGAHVLALEGFVPNPAVESPNVRFSLPNARPATLEVLDIAGRRVLSREVGALGTGRHALRLDGGARLSPGIYLLRLRTPERSIVTRAAVLR